MIRNILLIFMFSGVFTGIAYSQGSTGRAHRDPNYLVTRTVSEAIVSIDVKSSQLVCRDYDGKLHTLKVNDQTRFPSGAQTITLKDLHEGQRIRVMYRVVDSVTLEILPIESPRAK